jgi:hypothetical protein
VFKTEDSKMEKVLSFILCALLLVLGSVVGYGFGMNEGKKFGRNEIINEAVKNGSASLYCDSRTGKTEILWVTKPEDRKKVQKFMDSDPVEYTGENE